MVLPSNSVEGFYGKEILLRVVQNESRILDRKIFGYFSHHSLKVILELAGLRNLGDFVETFQFRIGSGIGKELSRHKRLLFRLPFTKHGVPGVRLFRRSVSICLKDHETVLSYIKWPFLFKSFYYKLQNLKSHFEFINTEVAFERRRSLFPVSPPFDINLPQRAGEQGLSMASETEMDRPRLVILLGPTGAGKSRLAMELAEAIGGEIISADSMQVYRYMDIGTDKPTPEEQKRVRHHLIDLVLPDQPFHAGLYRALGRKAIDQLAQGWKANLGGGRHGPLHQDAHPGAFSKSPHRSRGKRKVETGGRGEGERCSLSSPERGGS